MESVLKYRYTDLNFQSVDFDPFIGPKIEKVIPTIPSQMEIWLACIIGNIEANLSYNLSLSIELEGDVNESALLRSISKLVERHEILRSSITSDGKYLCIYENIVTDCKTNDISSFSEDQKDRLISKLNQSDSETLFELEKGPLFRVYLTKVSSKKSILKLTCHHIICDGWSFGVIVENLGILYSADVKGIKPMLKNVSSFSGYSKQILAHSKTLDYKKAETFWIDQFREVPIVDLPTDQHRPLKRTYQSKNSQFPISIETIRSIKSLGLANDSSLITTLIATLEIYLFAKTNKENTVIGLPSAGQPASGNPELVGHCVNLLPLKSEIDSSLSFTEYLRKRNNEIMICYENQQITFGSLLQRLKIERDTSRIPLVPFIFNVDIGLNTNVSFQGLSHKVSFDPRAYENFEIFLNIKETNADFTFDWSYNAQLFRTSTIEKMMAEYSMLLTKIIENPKTQILELKSSIRDFNNSKIYSELKTLSVADMKLPDVGEHEIKSNIPDQIQSTIYDIWTEVLGIKNLNVKDNFFEMGGHSLTAVKLTTRIRKSMGVRVPVSVLFENPTIEQFSDQIKQIIKN